MTQEAVSGDVTASTNTDVNTISEEQFDNYFKTGGKEGPLVDEKTQKRVPQDTSKRDATQAKPEEKTKDEVRSELSSDNADTKTKLSDESKNYKGMAHEERLRRQEEKARADALEQKMARMEQVWADLQRKAYEESLPKPPSFDENPLENIRYNQENINRQIQWQQQQYAQMQQQQHLELGKRQFEEDYRNKLINFGKENNIDIGNVYKYLAETKHKEFLNYGYNEQQAREKLIKEELEIVTRAYQDGINPAERIYNLAKALGYQDQQQNAQSNVTQQNSVNESAIQEASRKLETYERGLSQSKTLSNTGPSPSQNLTLSQIASMNNDELDDFVKDNKNWMKLAKIMK